MINLHSHSILGMKLYDNDVMSTFNVIMHGTGVGVYIKSFSNCRAHALVLRLHWACFGSASSDNLGYRICSSNN